jgi:hypothetical protein
MTEGSTFYSAPSDKCRFSNNLDHDSSFQIIVTQVQQSLYRPGQVLRVPGAWGSHIQDNGHMKVIRLSVLRTGHLYPSGYIRGTQVDTRAVVRSEGLCQRKVLMTPQGIEPATFRLVAQCLNQLDHRTTQSVISSPIQSLNIEIDKIISLSIVLCNTKT